MYGYVNVCKMTCLLKMYIHTCVYVSVYTCTLYMLDTNLKTLCEPWLYLLECNWKPNTSGHQTACWSLPPTHMHTNTPTDADKNTPSHTLGHPQSINVNLSETPTHTRTHHTPWRTHHHTWPHAQGTWDTSGKKIRTRGTATIHTDRMLRHFLAQHGKAKGRFEGEPHDFFSSAKHSLIVYTWLPLFRGHLSKTPRMGRKWSDGHEVKGEEDAANLMMLFIQAYSTSFRVLICSTGATTSPRLLHSQDMENRLRSKNNLALFNSSTFATNTNSWWIF
jgi:hypothetical protein